MGNYFLLLSIDFYTQGMNIKNENDGRHGRFVMDEDGKQIGMMVYVFSGPGKMIIEHTEVNEPIKVKVWAGNWLKPG